MRLKSEVAQVQSIAVRENNLTPQIDKTTAEEQERNIDNKPHYQLYHSHYHYSHHHYYQKQQQF